jgi:uncharacterized membrane protein YcaP (DUF421 family)
MKIATFSINSVNRRLPNLLQWLKSVPGTAPCVASLAATYVLITVRWIISYFTKDLPALGAFLKGHDRLLVKNGRIDRKALAESHMTMDDLEEDLREKGAEDQRASRKRAWSVAANCR